MSKTILEANKRRSSCAVCNRQSSQEGGLVDFTCYSCGISYTNQGTVDWSLQISKKKLHDEFQDKGIKLTDKEVDMIFAACFTMANNKKNKIRPTFQSLLAIAIESVKAKGTKGLVLTRDTGIITADGKKIHKEL